MLFYKLVTTTDRAHYSHPFSTPTDGARAVYRV
jgi:hypothetical protein